MPEKDESESESESERKKSLLLVVTGASRGLGRAIALAFCSANKLNKNNYWEKIHVILIARSAQGLHETKQLLTSSPSGQQSKIQKVSLYCMDLSDLQNLEQNLQPVWDEICQAAAAALTTTSDMDHLRILFINNAGSLGQLGPGWLEPCLSLTNMKQTVDFNVTSSLWISAKFIQIALKTIVTAQQRRQEHLAVPGTATLVNISSLTALVPFPSMGIYAAGKAARDMYHACLAKELQSMSVVDAGNSTDASNNIVKVLNFAPGPLETDMTTQLREASLLDKSLQPAFAKQLVEPHDSARVLVRLVWEDSFETGSHVDYYDVCNAAANAEEQHQATIKTTTAN